MTGQAATAAAGVEPAARATDRRVVLALAGWLAFVALVFYAIMLGGGYLGIQVVTLRVVSLVLIAVVLAGWAILAWRAPAWRPATAIWPALVIPLLSLGLSTMLSEHPRLGIEYLAWSVLLVALYLLLARILATAFARARIGGLAALLAGLIGSLYIAVVVGRWLEWWDLLGRLAVPPLRPGYTGLTAGGPNIVASVVLLLAVIAFAGLGTGTRGARIALALVSLVTAVTVLVSGSRSAWLGLAAAACVVAALWLLSRRHALAGRLRDRRILAGLGAGLVAITVAALALGPTILSRLLDAGDGGRPAYFASAIRMFEASPLVGLGPGNWAPRRIAFLEPGELEHAVPHVHDVYLQTLAELGVVGLVAGVVALAAVAWLVVRALRSADPGRRTWALAAIFALVYLAIVDVVDFYPNQPGALLLLAIPIAWLDAASDRGIGVPRALRPDVLGKLAVGALIVGCLGSIALLAWAESTAATSARAAAAADDQDWEAATVHAEAAAAVDPTQPGHQLTLALSAMHQRDWATARQAYAESVRVDDLPQAWLGLALATLEAAGPDSLDGPAMADVRAEVTGHLERAMRMGSQHAAVSYGVAEVYDRLGMTDEADAAYVQALTRQPALAADPAWRATPAWSSRFDRLLGEAIALAGTRSWQLALYAGDTVRARSLAAGDPAEALALDVIAGWEGDPDAIRRVTDRALDEATDPGLLATAALLTARTGDHATADRLRRLGATTVEGPMVLGLEVHTAPTCEGAARIRVASDLHGTLAYRRPTPADLMPPGVSCLVLHDPSSA